MRVDMDLSFIIPIRIESKDRLMNAITTISYLLNVVPEAQVYVKEVDSQSIFSERALPEIKKVANTDKLVHLFQVSEPESLFHRTKYINDLFMETTSKVVWHYDIDVLFPLSTYKATYDAIVDGGYDFMYPFGCGVYQNAVKYTDELCNKFIMSGYNLELLEEHSFRLASTVGFSQVFNRESYISFGMMNENFMSWGCEDCELYYRMMELGYKVGRINNDVYHLEHSRTFNSHYHNPQFQSNNRLWEWFRYQGRESILAYYGNQDYLKERLK